MLSVARLVFGAEPSNEEVYTWVLERWSSLRLSAEAEPVGPRVGRLPGNPKRRAPRRPGDAPAQGHRLLRNLPSLASEHQV